MRQALTLLYTFALVVGLLVSNGFAAQEAPRQSPDAIVIQRDPGGADQFQMRRSHRGQGEARAATPSANAVSPTLVPTPKPTAALPSPNSMPASTLQNSTQAPPAPGDRSARSQRYKLASGDSLAIKVYKYTDLSGEYLVRYDGSISVPVLGSLQVAGLEISDVERLLSERASKITHGRSYVSVEVSRYRPFYVVGFVEKPGAYAWQPGLSVLHAFTLAGGYPGIRAASPFIGDRETGQLNEKLRLLKRALIRRARLIAERDKKSGIIVPDQLRTLANDVEMDALVRVERRNLAERLDLMKSKKKNLEQAMMYAKEEISSLTEKQASIKRQIGLQNDLATRLRQAPKGIVQNARFMEVEILLARFVGEGRDTVADIARAKQRLSDAERSLKTLFIERRIEIDREINRLDLEIAGYNRTIATSNAILARMGSSTAGSTAALEARVAYVIVRKIGSKTTRLTVDEFADLLPGDILRVRGSLPVMGGSSQQKTLSGTVSRLP